MGVFTKPHHHNAANGLSVAVEFHNTPSCLRPELNACDIPHQDRRAVYVKAQRDRQEVFTGLDIAGRADNVFRLGHLDHGRTDFLVAPFDAVLDVGQGNTECPEFFGIHLDLVLLDHAADRGHFRNTGHCLQLVLQKPVLQGGQLTQVVVACPVNQGIQVNPADPGRVRPQLRPGRFRQTGYYLRQVFQHTGAGPVHVRIFIEDDIDIGVAEERVAPDRHRTGHRKHGGGQRIGHLILHHLRGLAGVAGFNDNLDIREIRQGIHRRL